MYTSSALVSRASYLSTSFLNDFNEDERSSHQLVHDRSSRHPTSSHQSPSFIHYQYPAITTSVQAKRPPLPSFAHSPRPFHHPEGLVMLFPSNPASSGGSLSPSSPPEAENFDFLSSLPPEITIKILLYLQPEDLCQVTLVCVRWHELTRYNPLEWRRKNYIDEKRAEYQKSKENYAPNSTGRRGSFSPSALTGSPGGPLNTIQPLNLPSPQLSSPTRFTWTDGGNQLAQQYQPPSPTYFLVEDVNRLSLDDKHHEIQRTFFVSDGPFLPPVGARKGMQSNLSTLRNTIKEVVGKKVNKSRLRRL